MFFKHEIQKLRNIVITIANEVKISVITFKNIFTLQESNVYHRIKVDSLADRK